MITMTWPQYLRRECRIGEFVIKLSPQETEVLSTLLMRYPESLSAGDLVETIWPDPDYEPDWAEATVAYVIAGLRRKLGDFRIGSRRGVGYHVVQRPFDMERPIKRRRKSLELRWAA